jgi:very-short-patch-repair endonuclease/predicted transcriptional regulator of viral defense system
MGSQTVQPARGVWAIARRDHDVISRRELLDLGFHRKAIEHRTTTGRLHRQARGVYSVGSPNLTDLGRLMVAIKRCGPGAVLSHLSAAVLWGIWKREPREIQVTVPFSRNPRPQGIDVRRRVLRPGDTTERHRIPVTTVLQTLIDCAPNRSRREVERMINQADALDLLRADVLHAEVQGRTEPGAVVVRGILDAEAFVLSDSVLEQLFVPIALRAGLPRPLTQQTINGYRVDFYWPELGLVVEVDGLRYHRTPLEQRRDLERRQAHEDAGLTCRRFTYWQVAKEAGSVEERLRRQARTPGRPRAA